MAISKVNSSALSRRGMVKTLWLGISFAASPANRRVASEIQN